MKLDRIDYIIGLGANCTTAFALQLFKIFSGRSPFDWCVTTPSTICKILLFLYTHGLEQILEIFKNLNMETKKIPQFEIHLPHFDEYGFDTFKRRFEKFYTYLTDTSKNILFVFSSPVTDEELPASSIIKDFFKLFKILCLFRPKETFEIAFIHTFYPGTVVKGDITQEMLDNHNITELLGGYTPPEERYWIYPCYLQLKTQYNLEHDPKTIGTWIGTVPRGKFLREAHLRVGIKPT